MKMQTAVCLLCVAMFVGFFVFFFATGLGLPRISGEQVAVCVLVVVLVNLIHRYQATKQSRRPPGSLLATDGAPGGADPSERGVTTARLTPRGLAIGCIVFGFVCSGFAMSSVLMTPLERVAGAAGIAVMFGGFVLLVGGSVSRMMQERRDTSAARRGFEVLPPHPHDISRA